MESTPPEQQARTGWRSLIMQGPARVFTKESSMKMFISISEHGGQDRDAGRWTGVDISRGKIFGDRAPPTRGWGQDPACRFIQMW